MLRRLAFLLPIGAIVLTIAIVVTVIAPTVRTINVIRRMTLAEHTLLEARYREGRILTRVLREFARDEPRVVALRLAIPAERDVLTLVEAIERTAAAHGLTETIAFDPNRPTADASGLVRIPVTVEFDGAYGDLLAALRDLERRAPPVAISSLAFTADPRSPGTARVHLTVRTDTVWQRTAQ